MKRLNIYIYTCMRTCACVYVCTRVTIVCKCLRLRSQVRMFINVCMWACVCVCENVHVCICLGVRMNVHDYVSMSVYVYVHMYMHVYVHMRVCHRSGQESLSLQSLIFVFLIFVFSALLALFFFVRRRPFALFCSASGYSTEH